MTRKRNKETKIERVFQDDEMALMAVNTRWTPEDLLGMEGIFFLKDVVKIIEIDPVKIKKKANEISKRNQSPWDVMGARKIWNHWIIRMTVFAPYYRKHLVSRVRAVDLSWDSNRLLEEKGIFFLTDVTKLLPFSTHQLRYQAKKNPNSRNDFGVWKDTELNGFLVDMDQFAPWIQRLWEGFYQRKRKP